MKKINRAIYLTFFVAVLGTACFADTLTHYQTKEILHGYLTSQTEDNKTIAQTQEKGSIGLNLAEWDIAADRHGRNNKVIVITIDSAIMFEIETAAAEQAITNASDEGPLFVLFEIDTPGGRTDFAQRICAAITGARNCPTIAYVKGGQYGGAISAGAALALACDKIYMAKNTIIGAATVIALSESGPKELSAVVGKEVGEKFSSAWRAYLASLAQQNQRSGLLARAMVDKDIEVVEVSTEENEKLYVESGSLSRQHKVVQVVSPKDSLLTLTGSEAVKYKIADQLADTRQQILRQLDAADAEVVINKDIQEAATKLKRARGQLGRIRKSVDFKVKQVENPLRRQKILSILRSAKNEFKSLIKLAQNYPDLNLDKVALENELNTIEAAYQKIKRESRRR